MIPHVATKWYELGAMLLDDEQEYRLREIRSNFGGDVQKCCLEMFHFWGASHPEANWYILVEALQSPGVKLDTVAFNIQKNFKGTLLNDLAIMHIRTLYVCRRRAAGASKKSIS